VVEVEVFDGVGVAEGDDVEATRYLGVDGKEEPTEEIVLT
jgi:hypothetical protein